jgi:hypothetical protein
MGKAVLGSGHHGLDGSPSEAEEACGHFTVKTRLLRIPSKNMLDRR